MHINPNSFISSSQSVVALSLQTSIDVEKNSYEAIKQSGPVDLHSLKSYSETPPLFGKKT